MKAKQEIEFKWTFHSKNEKSRLLTYAKSIGFKVSAPQKNFIIDQYLDTESSELARRRIKLRIRSVNKNLSVTFKSASRSIRGLTVRMERNLAFRGQNMSEIKSSICKRVRLAFGVDVNLNELFKIRNRRTVFSISKKGLAAELCFDHAMISLGKRKVRLREIELELIKGSALKFSKLVRRLTKIAGLKPARISKIATAYKHFDLPITQRVPLTPAEKKILFG